VEQIKKQQEAAAAAQTTLAAMEQGSNVVKNLTPAIQAQAEGVPA
jgi:hypothetical protein